MTKRNVCHEDKNDLNFNFSLLRAFVTKNIFEPLH